MGIPKFLNHRLASNYFAPEFDEAYYFRRTARNHHWIGGTEGQNRLKNLRVGIAGLGGMGSNVAEILVRLGVGHIKIADPDTIESTNLNRQVIANHQTIGVKKATASLQELRNIAHDFELVVYDDGITETNAAEFVSDLDILVDEIDVYPLPAHLVLHRAARTIDLPIYSGFIIGMGAHIYKFKGDAYTLEDFLLHDAAMISAPTPEFLVDRYINPTPSYLQSECAQASFSKTMRESGVPIFGASCFAAQSLLCIRLISDHLNLDQVLGTPPTPVMPDFLKWDPMDFTLSVKTVDDGRPNLKVGRSVRSA